MGIFWKRNRSRPLSARQEKSAGRIAAAIVSAQTRLADKLNRRTQYWNRSSKLILLAAIALLLGGFSLYQLIKLFT